MVKKIGIISLVIIFMILIIAPARNYFNNLFHKTEDAPELEERQIIGAIYGYNPRIRGVQYLLKKAGLDPGVPDGKMGPKTRKAIKEFQKIKALPLSGKIDTKTWTELHKQTEKLSAETDVPYDLSLVRQKSTVLEDENVKSELRYVAKEKRDIQDEIMSYRLNSKDRIKQIQTALKKRGFYKGDIDGKLGYRTKKAIIAFQKSKGLNPDGVVGPKTWEELNKDIK